MRKFSGLFAGLILLFASAAIMNGLYHFVRFWMEAPQGPTLVVFYEVKPGMSPHQVSNELKQLGVITSAKMFYWYGRMTGKLAKFKAGDYRFTTSMKPDEVMNIIMSGISFGYPIVIPEGYNIEQIAAQIEKVRPGAGDRFKNLCEDETFINGLGLFKSSPKRLEGFLFPDTYFMTRKTHIEDLIRQMVKNYRSVFSPELEAKAVAIGMTEFEVITLASIVERETGSPKERPMVASVFHNRLKKRMRLQSDPTVIYGLKNYQGNITKKDLLTPSPYNTYTLPGLPVGPIGNPGKESILAVLNPANTPFLYFVSHNDGTHEFTENYEKHRQAVGRFQLDRKAREGHSWRELNQKQPALPAK